MPQAAVVRHLMRARCAGAMPAFGNMCGMVTVVDGELAANDVIYTNAGTHKELFKLAWPDYEALVKPVIGGITIAV